ncbi:MAG: M20/M25/M40 family metallo-hydrolase [candidate division Zixibacteria bacterium]|nr:M20/M25/M40 family metallo-hydrolase [candidate division Zixibacteria bacterium]
MKVVVKLFAVIAVLAVVIAVPLTGALAEDFGLVTVKNKFQESVVKGIVDHAFVRNGNVFLCAINTEQAQLLKQSGVDYELILRDADPATQYIVRRRRPAGIAQVDLKKLGTVYDLGDGKMLTSMSRMAASSLQNDPDFFIHGLEELNIRILYLPVAVTGFLSGLVDYPSDSLADRVNLDSVYAWDTRLEAFRTRFIETDSIDAARDWMVQKFLSWGYTDVSTPSFWWGSSYYSYDWRYNVMAVKQGYAEPDKVIVIGGHYDSITYGQPLGPMIFAPGADDNASGTALTLELARIFADVPFRKTIIFMPFTAEEVGLVGSRHAAQSFVNDGTNLEVMLNWDMVAYDPYSAWQLNFSSGPNTAYRGVAVEAAGRVSALNQMITTAGGSSDHAAFVEQGFNVVNHIETNFNYPGWHTELDLSSQLNYPYYTDVVRTAAATVAVIADAAHPTSIEAIIDQGDGQAVEVFWSDCDPTYSYTVYYGPASGFYTDTVEVPPGLCSYVVDGMTEGVTYYFSVVGLPPSGYPAPYAVEMTAESYITPRIPTQVAASPDLNKIVLTWKANPEADLSHYRILRSTGAWELRQDNFAGTVFEDSDVLPHVEYRYVIMAVDNDGFQSPTSAEVRCVPATFDGGVLVVDEISESWGVPGQTEQVTFFNMLFGAGSFAMVSIDGEGDRLTRSTAGQYSSIFWIDDELTSRKYLGQSSDSLAWYLDYSNNVFVCGYRTIEYWVQSPYPPGLLYSEFGLSGFSVNTDPDFAGAVGQNGWPSAELDSDNVMDYLPLMPVLTAAPGAQVIYTFDSKDDNPAYEGRPCGLLMDTPGGKRILLAFPLLFLTDASAKAIIERAMAEFGEETPEFADGDVNRSGGVNISDVVYLVTYLFGGGPTPVDPNLADVNSSCTVNISDVAYLVSYLFGGGMAPKAGCVY